MQSSSSATTMGIAVAVAATTASAAGDAALVGEETGWTVLALVAVTCGATSAVGSAPIVGAEVFGGRGWHPGITMRVASAITSIQAPVNRLPDMVNSSIGICGGIAPPDYMLSVRIFQNRR